MGPEDPMGAAGDQGDDGVGGEGSAISVTWPGTERGADTSGTAPASSAEAAIQSLRQRGAAGWNPVRFRFIEALSFRAASRQGAARRLLDDKLAQALSAYETDRVSALQESRQRIDTTVARFPDSAAALESLHAAGDLAGLNMLIARLECRAGRRGEALADLVRHLQTSASSGDAPAVVSTETAKAGARASVSTTSAATHSVGSRELKTLRYFRGDWSRLSVDRRMNQSETQVPSHAGPLNSQVLALRALQQMRDLAPGYLAHFMTYLDTLLWLDQASQPPALPPKESPRTERKPKEKAARRKPG